jgi:hypothetical protein
VAVAEVAEEKSKKEYTLTLAPQISFSIYLLLSENSLGRSGAIKKIYTFY